MGHVENKLCDVESELPEDVVARAEQVKHAILSDTELTSIAPSEAAKATLAKVTKSIFAALTNHHVKYCCQLTQIPIR